MLAWLSLGAFAFAIAGVVFVRVWLIPGPDDPIGPFDELIARGLPQAFFAMAVTITGLVFGVLARLRQSGRGLAVIGIVLNALVFALVAFVTLQTMMGG
jgi:hypothetical protein